MDVLQDSKKDSDTKMEMSKTDATTEVQQMNSMVDVDEIEDDIEDT